MFITLGCKSYLVSPLDGRAVYIFLCDFLELLGLLTFEIFRTFEAFGNLGNFGALPFEYSYF